jgi:Chaperone of endosialidase
MAEIWGLAAAAVGAVAGSAISASGAKTAAGEQVSAEEAAQAQQMQMFQQEQSNEQPFIQGGEAAQSQLNYLLGEGTPGGYNQQGIGNTAGSSTAGGFGSLNQPFNMQDFKTLSPQYQFNLQQGGQGTLNNASSGQGAESGAALSALQSYNQNFANNSFNSAFQNYQTQQNNVFDRLSNLATLGANAGSNSATGASQFSNSIGNTTASIGASQAAGTVGAANAISGGIQSGANAFYGQNALNQILNGGSTVSYSNGNTASPGTPIQYPGTPYGSGGNTGDYCDYGLKRNVEPIYFDGTSKLSVYQFNYRWEDIDEAKWEGFIAQDVMEVYPDAVSIGPKGYLKVNYDLIPGNVTLKRKDG